MPIIADGIRHFSINVMIHFEREVFYHLYTVKGNRRWVGGVVLQYHRQAVHKTDI